MVQLQQFAATGGTCWLQVHLPVADAEADIARYDEEEGDTGGFGATAGKVQVTQQINHAGEVNRARVCPQNKFLIATKTVCKAQTLYILSRHTLAVPKTAVIP
jgi:histone-binding protein RBBP4